MANIKQVKAQQEITLIELKNKLLQEQVIVERNDRIYLTKVGQIALNETNDPITRNEIINPYLQARQEWDERMGYAVARETKWRQFAYLLFFLFSLSLFWNIKQSTQSHIAPYLIAQDRLGTLTPLGVPHKIQLNQGLTEQQLMVYIAALRTFSIDKAVNNHYIDIITAMTAANIIGKVSNLMKMQLPNPQPTTVQISNIQPLPNSHSFQIDWSETLVDSSEDGNSRTYWRAMITIKQATPPDDPVQVPNNPLGITITDITISPRVA